MSSVTLKNVCKTYYNGIDDYNGTAAVKDFNLEIKDGESIVFAGPSGCGKTTTLRMIAGLESITGGELYVDGQLINDVHPKDRDMAMVFQSYALYPHMTIFENIAFGLRPAVLPEGEAKARVEEIARVLDMESVLQRKPDEMSGGQRQRAALARALVRRNKVVLLDEPLSQLDAKLRASMRAELKALHQKLGGTFIYVTHSQDEAMVLADRVVLMRDGLIQQVGTPEELYTHPRNVFVAGFMSGFPQMNFWRTKVTEQDGGVSIDWDGVKINLPEDKADSASAYIGKEVLAGIRPGDFQESGDCAVEIAVKVREYMGDRSYLHFGDSFTARVSSDCKARSGDRIRLGVKPEKVMLFDKDTELAIF